MCEFYSNLRINPNILKNNSFLYLFKTAHGVVVNIQFLCFKNKNLETKSIKVI